MKRLCIVLCALLVSLCTTYNSVQAAEEGYEVSGEVQDEKGKPIQGATFSLYQYGSCIQQHIVSDANGIWHITLSDPGEYQLHQDSGIDGYEMDEEMHSFLVTDRTQTLPQIVNPIMKGSVSVHIEDTEQRSLPKLALQIQDAQDKTVWEGRTNTKGNVILPNLALGSYTIVFPKQTDYKSDEVKMGFTIRSSNYQTQQQITFRLTKKADFSLTRQPALLLFLLLSAILGGSLFFLLHRHGAKDVLEHFM